MEFTNIYISEKGNNINVLFFNNISKEAILFNGWSFINMKNVPPVDVEYKEIDYSVKLQNKTFGIRSIRESWDIFYIMLDNTDVFQIYSMADDRQHLSVFTKAEHGQINTPSGLSLYDDVLKSFNKAEECNVEVEK